MKKIMISFIEFTKNKVTESKSELLPEQIKPVALDEHELAMTI